MFRSCKLLFLKCGHHISFQATVNLEFYKGLLQHLRDDLQKKGPEKSTNGYLLQRISFWQKTLLPVHIGLDLIPCDLWLFPKIESTLQGKCFDSSPFRKVSRNAFNHEINLGISASLAMENSLKGVKTNLM